MAEERNIALVTGGAVRIGRAISLAFADAGFSVVVHCRNHRKEADALCREIARREPHAANRTARTPPRAWAVEGDLSDPAACDAVFDAAWTAAGRIDALVNNAAIFARTPLADASAADFESQWRVNALAPDLLARRFAQALAAGTEKNGAPLFKRHAAIVNLLDQRLARPSGGCIPYVMAKAALEAFTRAAAVELAPLATVNAVAPGPVLPPPPEHGAREPAGQTLLPTRPTPEAIARAVVTLATSPSITGQTLFVDSGQHLL
jgi:NAD(P)-dependent dehydrogenase (short-subunit alcohol dehydrogenase family)